ncbi:phage major capsid protein [Roseateles sp. BYS96W]|uniref:Phage major capsid protein n=1 Tax=Pelomonas nitida TaxID=3299027 RepID=A0ABW7G7D0_9BURK
MPAADAADMDNLLGEIESIDAEIARELRAAALAGANGPSEEELRNRHTRTQGAHAATSSAFRAFLTGGLAALSQDQLGELRARQAGGDQNAAWNLPQAAMSTTTPAEGGFTVAPEFSKSLEVAMRAYGAMLGEGERVRTSSGAQMNVPAADPTAEEGEIVGQNGPATGLDTAFSNITIDVYRYSSKKIAVPWELIQDSMFDIEGYIQSILAVRLGRIRGKHTTIGTGTGQPRGIVTGSGTGKTGTTGQTTSVIYDDLIDLEHSVDPAYRNLPGVGFMMHDTSLAKVRKLKDSNGRPIFVPGYEQGNPGGAPDRLLNRRIVINQEMPTMAASAKSILFGAFSKYWHREVMDFTLFRFTDSAFTLNGQVGFCAFQRCGGNLVDVGGAVKAYVNSAT